MSSDPPSPLSAGPTESAAPAPASPAPAGVLPMRRPLKFRETKLAAELASRLAASGLQPNTISIWSAIFSLIAGVLIAVSGRFEPGPNPGIVLFGAIVMIALRGLCNVLDGMVAIEHGKRTKSGELYNELPDRFADAFIFAGAGYVYPSIIWLGWATAVLAVITAYVRTLGAAMGAGQHFIGPMQKTHRMAVMAGACVLAGIVSLFGGQVGWVMLLALVIISLGCLITIAMRCLRIIEVVESK